MFQLEFFPEDENRVLKGELIRVKESSEKVRRALFARHGELAKKYMDLLGRLEILESNICKGTIKL